MRFIDIQSRVGTVGAFFVLQAYGLLLFYELSRGIDKLQRIRGVSLLELIPQFLFFMVLYSAFGFVQSKLIMGIESFLKTDFSIHSCRDELVSSLGKIRALVGICFFVLLLVLWFRPELLGFDQATGWIVIAYQVGHPVTTYLGGKMFGAGREIMTATVYMSKSTILALISWWIVGGIAFWLLDVIFIKDPIRIFGTAGLGISALGMMLFLVDSLEGKEREFPVE